MVACVKWTIKKKKDKNQQFLPAYAKPEPHPMVPLYCKYFRYLQLFRAVELDAGLELYSWSSK